jgi:hypothetical protein
MAQTDHNSDSNGLSPFRDLSYSAKMNSPHKSGTAVKESEMGDKREEMKAKLHEQLSSVSETDSEEALKAKLDSWFSEVEGK